ncbi:MAG: HAD-IIA family hydrolase [Conexivisphaerales archaeon]
MSEAILKALEEKELFIIDADGTLYVGNTPTPKAREFLKLLDKMGKKHMIMTNNSSYSTYQHAARMSRILGYRVRRSGLLVSTNVAVKYIKDNGFKSVHALGVPAFKDELKRNGIKLSLNYPELVVIAFDKTLTYRKLSIITKLIMDGIPYIATHPDILCPVNAGYIPDIGAILAFVKTATGKEPQAIVGKPNRMMVDYALTIAGTGVERSVLFGDRLYTDIKMANEVGMTSVLVLTGETKNPNEGKYRPDFVINTFKDILTNWGSD